MAAASSPSVVRDAAGRRVIETDRHAAAVVVLRWRADGRLADARVRLPDSGWVTIEPRVGHDATWGPVDRLHWGRHGRDATVFAALDYHAVDRIPVLAEPARLPAGAGTAVLNLIAALAADQGCAALSYDGPYPTEQLFTALLESFHYMPADAADPLAAFANGALTWAPAPHERDFDPVGVYVQRRDRVDKVVAGGISYYRDTWQAVRRHAPRRVWDDAGMVRCSLWALGEAVEHHLLLTPAGDVVEIQEPPPSPSTPAAMDRAVTRGVIAIVRTRSAPALASSIDVIGQRLRAEWGSVERDLIAVRDGTLHVSLSLRDTIARRLRGLGDRRARLELAFAALSEMALLAGDPVRTLAQAHLARASAEEQASALRAGDGDTDDRREAACAIAAAVEALAQELA